MSVNKKNRSLWGSRSEAQRIYYQRQTIKRLEKENNQLKLDFELYKDNHIYKNYEVERKDIIIKELRSWLEDKIHNIVPEGCGINYNCEYDSEEDYVRAMEERSSLHTLKDTLDKLNELEGGKND